MNNIDSTEKAMELARRFVKETRRYYYIVTYDCILVRYIMHCMQKNVEVSQASLDEYVSHISKPVKNSTKMLSSFVQWHKIDKKQHQEHDNE